MPGSTWKTLINSGELLATAQEEREPGFRGRLRLLCRERHGLDPVRRVDHPYRPELPPRWRPRAPWLRADFDAADEPGRGDRRPSTVRLRPALAPARRPLRPRGREQAQQGDPDHLYPPRHFVPREGRFHPYALLEDLGDDRGARSRCEREEQPCASRRCQAPTDRVRSARCSHP